MYLTAEEPKQAEFKLLGSFVRLFAVLCVQKLDCHDSQFEALNNIHFSSAL